MSFRFNLFNVSFGLHDAQKLAVLQVDLIAGAPVSQPFECVFYILL